jgi:hypothetical protein
MKFVPGTCVFAFERDLQCTRRTHIPLIAPLGRIVLEADEEDLLRSVREFERPIKRTIIGRLLGYPVFRIIYGKSLSGIGFAEIPVASERARLHLLTVFKTALDELEDD